MVTIEVLGKEIIDEVDRFLDKRGINIYNYGDEGYEQLEREIVYLLERFEELRKEGGKNHG